MAYSLDNYDLRLALQRGLPYEDIFAGYAPSVLSKWTVGDAYGLVSVGGFIYAAITNTFPGIVRKIDASTGVVVADIVVGNDPRGLCYDGSFIWCADYDLNRPGNTVSKIDPATDSVIATITVGSKPGLIEYDGAGYVWVACLGSTSVYRIDVTTNAVSSVNLGSESRACAFDNRAYVFFTCASGLKKIRTTTLAVTAIPGSGSVTYGLGSAADFLWGTDLSNKVFCVNRMTNSVETIIAPRSPTRRPGFDGRRAWVPCGVSEHTLVYDGQTRALVADINVGSGSNKFVCFDNYFAYISAGDDIAKIPLF